MLLGLRERLCLGLPGVRLWRSRVSGEVVVASGLDPSHADVVLDEPDAAHEPPVYLDLGPSGWCSGVYPSWARLSNQAS